jgi:hypothetical protein
MKSVDHSLAISPSYSLQILRSDCPPCWLLGFLHIAENDVNQLVHHMVGD